VIAAIKRTETQKKIYHIDDKIGVAIAGLTADARKLSAFMKDECLNYKFTNNSNFPINRLVVKVADSMFCVFLLS
jgi:20S proteasome subunit alpha 6